MSTLPPPTFGALLRRARRTAGLSQEALAEQAGLSVDAISALERGVTRAPHAETLHLRGEHEYPLVPLQLPEHDPRPEALS